MNCRRITLIAIISIFFYSPALFSPELTSQAKSLIEADWARQELVSRGLQCGQVKAVQGVLSRGVRMIGDMKALGVNVTTVEKVFTKVKAGLEKVASSGMDNREAYIKGLYMEARWALRELAFSNPAIDFEKIVFVKRQWPFRRHQCVHRIGEAQIPGANLCILDGLSPDGKITELLDAAHAKGGVGRFDLSYDAKRIVFPYAAPRPQATPYVWAQHAGMGGECIMYDIYEVNTDGTGLRQLTDNPESEDTEPAYLPSGRIAFISSRQNHYVQCGDWATVCGLYSMDMDGGDVKPVTVVQDSEFYPSVLEDGRILYTRWDYVMKPYNVIQQLWTVNPDGRNAELAYGDHYAFSEGPIAFFEARQVPGIFLSQFILHFTI